MEHLLNSKVPPATIHGCLEKSTIKEVFQIKGWLKNKLRWIEHPKP